MALGWQPTRSVLAQVSYGPLKLHEPRTGALDIQDRGIQFSLTFHPLAPFAPD